MPFVFPKSFGTMVSGAAGAVETSSTSFPFPRGRCVVDYGLRYLRSAAPLMEELIWKVRLISVGSQQLSYFIRITDEFKAPVDC